MTQVLAATSRPDQSENVFAFAGVLAALLDEDVERVDTATEDGKRALFEHARRDDTELVVLERGDGTLASHLLREGLSPVVVIDGEDQLGDGPILVAVDGSHANLAALEFAEQLALTIDREVIALFCPDPLSDSFPHPPHHTTQPNSTSHLATGALNREGRGWEYPSEDAVYKELESALGSATRLVVEPGDPGEVLPRVARRERAAMVVLGTRGQGSFGGAILGALPKTMLAHRDRPLAIVPHDMGVRS